MAAKKVTVLGRNGSKVPERPGHLTKDRIQGELKDVLEAAMRSGYNGHIHLDVSVQGGYYRKLEVTLSRVWLP